ncbi:MAG: rhodanese-like domain-containing protein [Clostridia bacterium]|nr:rhodanese-like domain-containing protein [Clostridia bacterium]
MKNIILYLVCVVMLASLASCGSNDLHSTGTTMNGTAGTPIEYLQVSAEEAKQMMSDYPDAVILDVREADEYNSGHIPGAVLLPYGDIPEKAHIVLPDKEKMILIYCRSGRRSKIAAESLTALGYTAVYEFGGIIDWSYETQK